MIEWITLLLDNKFLMRANGILGFLLLGCKGVNDW